jgi:hypothetical protein
MPSFKHTIVACWSISLFSHQRYTTCIDPGPPVGGSESCGSDLAVFDKFIGYIGARDFEVRDKLCHALCWSIPHNKFRI